MNDRLKFKVWNKEDKKFEDEGFYLDDEGNLCCDTWDDGLIGAGDNYTVVCCTGLKDKNGKLIYEGNILRHNGKLLIVKYQEEMACFAPQHFYLENDKIIYCGREWFEEYNNEDCKLYTSNSYEVIGNIYENPELLDKILQKKPKEIKSMHLTKKQKLIWKLIAHGYSNKEICDYCFIELSTVNTHIKAIYQYLGLPTMGRGATNRIKAANCYWMENIEELKKFKLEE